MTNFGTAPGVGECAQARPDGRAQEEKSTREQAERWLTLLSVQLTSVGLPAAASESTSAWHPGAEDLTPSNRAPSPSLARGVRSAPGLDEGANASENRLIVRVDGGDLGELALLVDRKDGAIAVTIGARDTNVQQALGLERASLLRALQSQGIKVDSLKFVSSNELGTVIANSGSKASSDTREATEAESKDDEQVRRRSARKLNLVG